MEFSVRALTDEAHIDFETGCAAELVGPRSVGVHRYAEDETFRVWLFSWRIGDGVIRRWKPGDDVHISGVHVLLSHIASGGIVIAHNAMFERTVWNAMRAKYGLWDWPEIKIEQQRDTMATAMSLNLPASLDMLGKVLGLKQQKDDEGAKLMKQMAKPVRLRGDKEWSWPHNTPENIARLGDYCDQDVRTETEVDHTIGKLSPAEQEVWNLDQKINDRGIPLDVPLIMRAIDVTEYAKKAANVRISELTGGAVKKYTEVSKIIEWINAQGVECLSFRKSDHEDLLIMSGLVGKTQVEQVINIRRGAGKTSTSKFLKMLECVCADARARGQFAYHGATQTGRWAGRLIQPQNLVRVDWDRDADLVQWALMCLAAPLTAPETYDMLAMFAGEDKVLDILSKCLRPMIRAEEGHTLYGADYSNIEGRVNAWLAGEEWKLEAFRAYDAGTGPDLYKVAYSRSFGVPIENVGKAQRQIGKIQELALGYQGGVGAFITMGTTSNVQPHTLVKPVQDATSAELWDKVSHGFLSASDKHGLPVDQWTAIKIIVNGWREANSRIKAGWYELMDCVVSAVDQPGLIVTAYGGRVRYVSDKAYLYCQLPDGRVICYPQPTLRYEKKEEIEIGGVWYDVDDFFEFEVEAWRNAGARFRKSAKYVVYFMGIDPETKQWKESYLYGGHCCENVVQGFAASIQRRGMLNVEAAGYPIILHAHDEILAHVRKGYGSLKHFEDCMKIDEPWVAGLPLAVSSFEDERYVK
jgi:DNA polymerase